jgi:primosomal replication protein N
LRYTPAGIPAIDFVLEHSSVQVEAGSERRVRCTIQAVALGEVAGAVKALPAARAVRITGFLAQRAHGDPQVVLHATAAEQAQPNSTDSEARSEQ